MAYDYSQGLKFDDTVIRWLDCPDCQGRGWFLINPFATGGGNGVGGVGNARQCPRCKSTKEYYDAHGGQLPPDGVDVLSTTNRVQ